MKLRDQLERLEVSNREKNVAANSNISNSCTGGGCNTVVEELE
ncbi:hypothetical protein [Sporosarcina sp. Te-1]|nr:hypothetical protein [Sporosarcina sp. Te-1]